MRFLPALTVTLLGMMAAGLVSAASGESPNGSLIGKTEVSEASKRTAMLEQILQLSRAETEFYRQQWVTLRLRDEALGMSALTGDRREINDKLVQLLGELFQSEKRNIEWQSLSADLIEKSKSLLAAAPKDQAQRRAEFEVVVRKIKALAGGERQRMISLAPDFTGGTIISVSEDLQVAVVNFGVTQKAQIGMPYRILRDNKVIGRCSLIDVHAYLSAARIESVLEKEQVQPGCRVLLETTKAAK
ncbi:MAG: hypothetical protein LBD30_08775 [Verrucomicrobiales bacterium]|jgi:hypothetical protein|nr:hypothetical protein [Verrucomicrobiales bacterium]